MDKETDWTEMDGSPLTERDTRKLRAMIQDYDRAAWARRKMRIIIPVLVSVVVAVWQLFEWVLSIVARIKTGG